VDIVSNRNTIPKLQLTHQETLSHVDLASLLKIHELLQLMRERMKGQPKEGATAQRMRIWMK
jgi:hypothetical protein